ncbi:MAG: hypothetical protein ACRDBI_15780 [Shewanella sp.]
MVFSLQWYAHALGGFWLKTLEIALSAKLRQLMPPYTHYLRDVRGFEWFVWMVSIVTLCDGHQGEHYESRKYLLR